MNKYLVESSRLRRLIRDFFSSRNYLEVQTPILVECPGAEANLDYFSTKWTVSPSLERELFLRSSPELDMKMLLSELKDSLGVFQLAPSFRNNGEYGTWHRPEFTMLEWYGLQLDLEGLSQQTEEFLLACTREFRRTDLQTVEKYSAHELMIRLAGVDFVSSEEEIFSKASEVSLSIRKSDSKQDTFFKVWIEKIEPYLAKIPIAFVSDWPDFIPTLAQSKKGKASRLEVYVFGLELSNGYLETLGEDANRQAFSQINKNRVTSGKVQKLFPPDRFFNAMHKLEGRTVSGNALGFERLLSICTGSQSLLAMESFLP